MAALIPESVAAMKNADRTIAKGKEVIEIEGKAVQALGPRVGESFARAVDIVERCQGRVIITGVGKSGIIARKIVATLNSTGTPAVFLHPSDAVHGDLGIVGKDDVVICVSKSGNTKEMNTLLPMFRRLGVPIIALVGAAQSPSRARPMPSSMPQSRTKRARMIWHRLRPQRQPSLWAMPWPWRSSIDGISTRKILRCFIPGGASGGAFFLRWMSLWPRGVPYRVYRWEFRSRTPSWR